MFPGMEIIAPGLVEGVASYSISGLEVLQALGVFGVIGFMFVMGLKVFKLLPTEARAFKRPAPVE
jgi:Ni/Fe-hydrogenase subunit HybB-like protein